MPIYEYVCEECGAEYEELVRSISASQDSCCPRCGSKRVKKAVSLVGRQGASSGTVAADCSCAPSGG